MSPLSRKVKMAKLTLEDIENLNRPITTKETIILVLLKKTNRKTLTLIFSQRSLPYLKGTGNFDSI